jgi:hypothetical protein
MAVGGHRPFGSWFSGGCVDGKVIEKGGENLIGCNCLFTSSPLIVKGLQA